MRQLQVTLLGVRIDVLTMAEALAAVERCITAGGFHHIVTPGPEFLLEATAHPRFRQILNRSDLSLPEGMGLRIGSLLTGQPQPGRVPGADFVEALMRRAATASWSVFLFGAGPGIGERAAAAWMKKYPSLRIVGIESGHRGVWAKVSDRRVVERIHLVKPDILLVALGAPKQELWIDRHRAALHDVKVAIGVGRTLDYAAGQIRRPPTWLRALGLEWVGTWAQARSMYQPTHRRRRIFNATWHFIWTVIRHGHARAH